MGISVEDVRKVAKLAKLQLSEAEESALTHQLGNIVAFVEQLSAVNTDGVEPLSNVMELHSVLRPDAVHQSLPRDAALANSPQHDDECFRVPPVM